MVNARFVGGVTWVNDNPYKADQDERRNAIRNGLDSVLFRYLIGWLPFRLAGYIFKGALILTIRVR